jgi:hypothetical protein
VPLPLELVPLPLPLELVPLPLLLEPVPLPLLLEPDPLPLDCVVPLPLLAPLPATICMPEPQPIKAKLTHNPKMTQEVEIDQRKLMTLLRIDGTSSKEQISPSGAFPR